MPKNAKPIAFEKIGPNLYRTPSRSEKDTWYNVAFVGEGQAMCCCYAAIRRGQNGCAHAKALVGQATFEEPQHIATYRDGSAEGSNYVVECSCGWVSHIAGREDFAQRSVREHVWAYTEEAKEERRRRMWS